MNSHGWFTPRLQQSERTAGSWRKFGTIREMSSRLELCCVCGMTAVRRPEDLFAWRLCRQLSDIVYEITEAGPCLKDREFRNQIREAAEASAPLIAEGFARFKPGVFVNYLRMACGEIAEVQSKLDSAKAKGYFTADQQAKAEAIAQHAMAVTTLLLKSKLPLVDKPKKRPRRRGL
jgi:four helix bundle protein